MIEDNSNDWYFTPADWATDYDLFLSKFSDIIVDQFAEDIKRVKNETNPRNW